MWLQAGQLAGVVCLLAGHLPAPLPTGRFTALLICLFPITYALWDALQATVVAMEGAAARWQAQAGEVEQGLALLRFRLADLLAEVKWCLEDYSDASDAGVR